MGNFFILDCDQMGDFTLLCNTCMWLRGSNVYSQFRVTALVADSKIGTLLTLYVGQM
jgi:hypothetical protein